ncbi:LysR family transcriptional regulator [Rhodovibrionaceae bacterium A322]
MNNDKVLSAVVTLAQCKSFQEAAQILGMSMASLSRHISRAEEQAGMALFERRRQGTVLTTAGRKYLQLAQELSSALTQFDRGVAGLQESGGDLLNIGCGPLAPRTLIQPVVTELRKLYPKLRLKILVSATKDPLNDLRNGDLDVVVGELTHTADLSDLDLQVIKKQSVSFFARPDHPIHQKGAVSLKEIFQQDLLSPHLHKHWSSSIARILGDDSAAWERVKALPTIECDDYNLLISLTKHSDGLCGGMRETFSEALAAGELKEVRQTQPLPWNICAAKKKSVSLPALDTFWDLTRQRFGEINGQNC